MCQSYDDPGNDQRSNHECACSECCECESENENERRNNNNKRKAVGTCHLPYLDNNDVDETRSSPVSSLHVTRTAVSVSVSVFGVDAKKRINLWDDESYVSAAIIINNNNNRIFDENDNNENNNENNEIIGMSFDNIFPSSSFLSSSSSSSTSSTSTSNSHSLPSSEEIMMMIPLSDVLDKVIRNGKAEVNVDVKLLKVINPSTTTIHNDHHQRQRGKRKRTRRWSLPSSSESTTIAEDDDNNNNNLNHDCRDDNDEDNDSDDTTTTSATTIFSVDLFPQFDVTTTTNDNKSSRSKRIVTGVVLVCTSKRVIDINDNDNDNSIPCSLDDAVTIVTDATATTAGSGASSDDMIPPAVSSCQHQHQQQYRVSDASSIDTRVINNYNNNNHCSNCIIREQCSSCNINSDETTAMAKSTGSGDGGGGGGGYCTANNELRKLIDTANTAIFGIDRNGIINEWNDKTAETTGYEKSDAFGSSLVDTYIKPNIRKSFQDILNDATNDGKCKSNYEIDFRTKYNEIRHLLVNITPQRDMDNNIIGVVMIAQDVTEAVKRDRSVAGMALELRQLINTANAPIFGIDCDMNVNEWNRKISEITEYSKEEATGVPLVETFIAPLAKMKVDEILEHALAGFETSNYELEVISKSGESIFLLVNATTRRDPDGLIIGVVGVAQDVTEDRKKAVALRKWQTLRASQEAKVETERNMTAYFAHELRNPLGAIDSALNSMPDDLPDMAQSLISGMQLCSTFMSKIMNNLLDVRKMEEGKMQLRKAPISLSKLLFNVHKMLLPSCRPGVDFRTTLPKYDAATKGNNNTNDWVIGDQHRIEQVLTNVISNSIKYTTSGHIELSVKWEDGNVKFICEDSGPGIPIQEQKKLFQRFIQRGGAPGTGLGLAIAKHVVDLTGGSIRFDSDPTVKAGTSCIVHMALPLCKAPTESTAEKKKCAEVIQEPISCLIIDDIKMNRTMLKRRLKKAIAPNATITEAATGEEALLICGRDRFDVIVVDQFMEGAGGVMVGTDVVFAMRRMRIGSIIIGCSGNDLGTQFIDAGADWVWQKPMPSNDKIIQDLRTSLGKRTNSS
jgi:PAS domain S-box-containing protein